MRGLIPPGSSAQRNPSPSSALKERNRNIRSIRRLGRREWCKRSGYTKRAMVENAIYRYKTMIGRGMRSRTLAGQCVEVQLACRVLNTMTRLGMPDSYRVACHSDGVRSKSSSSRATTPLDASARGSRAPRRRPGGDSFPACDIVTGMRWRGIHAPTPVGEALYALARRTPIAEIATTNSSVPRMTWWPRLNVGTTRAVSGGTGSPLSRLRQRSPE